MTSSNTALIDREALHGAFRQWQAELEPLDTQLSESLAALSAYQSHLDDWQQRLVRERDELRADRERFEQERASSQLTESEAITKLTAELDASREKNSALTAALLARTEEFRVSDVRRVELVTALESSRAREKELRDILEETGRSRELERSQWAEELRQLRETLDERATEQHLQPQAAPSQLPIEAHPPQSKQVLPPSHAESNDETAVFGSVLQQFGKLRQQRVMDRHTLKKAR